MVKTKKFEVDARTILQLGRDSIKDHTTALVELVKNSYDADAKQVVVEIYCAMEDSTQHYIRIADNGFGMSEEIIDDNFLRIGFSEKKHKKRSQSGRRKTGEKGIGRIAADRLGAKLTLKSKSLKSLTQGLIINWDDFDVDKKKLSDIEIQVIEKPIIKIPNNNPTGTEIIIEKLRQIWTEKNIEVLYSELSTLVSPFDDETGFEVKVKTDISNIYKDVKVEATILDAAEVNIEMEYDGIQKSIDYYISDRKYNVESLESVSIDNIIYREEASEGDEPKLRCGPIKMKLLFIPRDSTSLKRSTFASLTSFRKSLDEYVGIKIYRDSIAVKPYGYKNSELGDWLGLASRKAQNPAGVGRKDYRVTSNQIVGAAFITRDDNPNLHDSASREGLVQNEAYYDLEAVVFKGIQVLEAHRHMMEVQTKKKTSSSSPKKQKNKNGKSKSDRIDNITENISKIGQNLRDIGQKFSKSSKDDNQVNNLSSALVSTADSLDKQTEKLHVVIEELLNENRVLNGLATLGISTAVFGHETQSALSIMKQASSNAKDFLSFKTPDINEAIKEVKKIYKYSKLVAGWGSFALARVKIEKRKNPTNYQVNEIIENAINEIKPAFKSSDIEIKFQLEKIISKVYPMDIEAIIFNLMTNSFQACKQRSQNRKIVVSLFRENMRKVKGYIISVEDSGPGIAKEFIHKIWEPLFTTKINSDRSPTGTGLGLTIIESIVDELNGQVNVM